mmetsp:Transcript_76861/g.217849  ORF Transcript_76861/g.217849 Transcript_76861/m.217849 type:complete len:264 (+) Transcript_76861:684-1475(+)
MHNEAQEREACCQHPHGRLLPELRQLACEARLWGAGVDLLPGLCGLGQLPIDEDDRRDGREEERAGDDLGQRAPRVVLQQHPEHRPADDGAAAGAEAQHRQGRALVLLGDRQLDGLDLGGEARGVAQADEQRAHGQHRLALGLGQQEHPDEVAEQRAPEARGGPVAGPDVVHEGPPDAEAEARGQGGVPEQGARVRRGPALEGGVAGKHRQRAGDDLARGVHTDVGAEVDHDGPERHTVRHAAPDRCARRPRTKNRPSLSPGP